MALNKLETQIKEQLNAREIKPTEMAWDRLDAMLSVAEEKKSKRGFNWLSIAAVFIGFILIGFFLFQLNSNEIPIENQVVHQEKNPTSVEDASKNPTEIVNANSQIATIQTQVAEVIKTKNKKSIINQKTNLKSIPQGNQVVENNEVIAENATQTEIKIEPNIKIVPIKVNPDKLLASVESSKKEKTSKSSVNVNVKSMLAQAEGEQNQNFKETRFQKFKRNFKTVKNAVENRNIQE